MGNKLPVSCHPLEHVPEQLANRSPASVIFVGGTILTMVDRFPTAEALAIKDDKILAVGKKSDILRDHKGERTKIVELKGKQTLMPGIVDPHSHPACVSSFKFLETISAFSGEFNTPEKVLAKVKSHCDEQSQKYDPPRWIGFFGWDPALVRGLPKLNAKILDEIASKDYPVFILAQTMHSAWINTKGLELCGVTADTPSPNGGVVVKDENGNPTGMFKEQAAIQIPYVTLLAQYRPLDVLENIFATLKEYAKEGITTVAELGSMPLTTPALGLLTYITSLPAAVSPLRLGFYVPGLGGHAEMPPPIFGNEKLFFPGVKIWADGSPYTGTMATIDNYLDTELTRALDFDLKKYPNGLLTYRDDEKSTGLEKQVADIKRFYNVSIATHCHGERAIEQSLDAYEEVIRRHPEIKSDHRFRIEHLGLITDKQLKRATALGVTASFYIDHVYYYGDALRDGIVGKERAERFSPVGLAIKNGQKHWTTHDDSPASPIHPFQRIINSMERRPILEPETQLGKQYCVKDINEGLKSITINAAWQLKKDKELGSLEVGKLADLVILSDDPRKVEELPNIKAIKTYLGGVIAMSK